MPPQLRADGGVVKERTVVRYFAIRYVRSPAAFFEDSIFSPPLLGTCHLEANVGFGCDPNEPRPSTIQLIWQLPFVTTADFTKDPDAPIGIRFRAQRGVARRELS